MSISPFGDDLITLLQDAGVGTLGVDLFEGLKSTVPQLPEPSATVHVVPTAGTSPTNTHNSTLLPAYINPGAQITVRARASADAEAKVRDAYAAVHIRNQFVNSGWYLWISPLQEPFPLPEQDTDDERWVFNVTARRRYAQASSPTPPVAPITVYQLVEFLGGDSFSFVNPAIADSYAAGSTFDTLVPSTSPVQLDLQNLYSGSYYLEASARVAGAGARAKVGIFDLTSGPNSPLVEITFTADELVGERKRSAAFQIPAVPGHLLGVKVTTNNIAIGAAAWGCRIVRA